MQCIKECVAVIFTIRFWLISQKVWLTLESCQLVTYAFHAYIDFEQAALARHCT